MANDSDWVEKVTANDEGKPREATRAPAAKDLSAKRLHAAAHSKNNTIRRGAEPAETSRTWKSH